MANLTVFENNKTPKALLEEICVKNKFKSNFVPAEEVSKTPQTFKSVCIVSRSEEYTVESEGYATTKRDAEQLAAWKILPLLLTTAEFAIKLSCGARALATENQLKEHLAKPPTPRSELVKIDDVAVSDTDDNEIVGDPVGALLTICQRRKLPEPKFEFEEKPGPGNKRIFTVTCKSGEVTAIGKRHVKKDAKKVAAYRLRRAITRDDCLPSTFALSTCSEQQVSSSQEEKPQQASAISIELKDFSPNKRQRETDDVSEMKVELPTRHSPPKKSCYEETAAKLACQKPASHCLKFVQNLSHIFAHIPLHADVKKAMANPITDPVQLLDKVCVVVNAVVKFTPCLSTEDQIVFCQVGFKHNSIFKTAGLQTHIQAGRGNCMEAAKIDSARAMLTYLKQMMFDF